MFIYFCRERRLFTCDSPSTSAHSAPTRFVQKKSSFSLMVKFIFGLHVKSCEIFQFILGEKKFIVTASVPDQDMSRIRRIRMFLGLEDPDP